ncbi:MAG: helix-turn-helix domain-containing protein, partial [Clostridia bacterium]|nr:helix-turn-helix domain-containing protein [Clostridia bacterium]
NFYMEKFTERFNEALKQTNISQTELAQKIGISKQCLSDYKSGKAFPSIRILKQLCIVLEISSDYLLGLTDY